MEEEKRWKKYSTDECSICNRKMNKNDGENCDECGRNFCDVCRRIYELDKCGNIVICTICIPNYHTQSERIYTNH
jgi:hypothetical protein